MTKHFEDEVKWMKIPWVEVSLVAAVGWVEVTLVVVVVAAFDPGAEVDVEVDVEDVAEGEVTGALSAKKKFYFTSSASRQLAVHKRRATKDTKK